jgi:hypothetical protein
MNMGEHNEVGITNKMHPLTPLVASLYVLPTRLLTPEWGKDLGVLWRRPDV